MKSFLAACVLALGMTGLVAPADAAGVQLIVRHSVTDYAAWRKVYDGFNATQKKMGVAAQAVYQSVDDPNDVTVMHQFATLDAAREFLSSSELRSTMQSAGVAGMPQIWVTREAPGSSGRDGKVRLFVQHQVASYGEFRKTYVEFAPVQKKLGVATQAVYWQADNANNVIVIHDFASVDKAKAFVGSSELSTAMQGAGVKGAPQVWFTRRALK